MLKVLPKTWLILESLALNVIKRACGSANHLDGHNQTETEGPFPRELMS